LHSIGASDSSGSCSASPDLAEPEPAHSACSVVIHPRGIIRHQCGADKGIWLADSGPCHKGWAKEDPGFCLTDIPGICMMLRQLNMVESRQKTVMRMVVRDAAIPLARQATERPDG